MTEQPLVYVADDEPELASMISEMLSDAGYAVNASPDGATLLRKVGEKRPDLILLDINMPGMTGLEMLPKVKAERPNVPVIMITAYGDETTVKRASELGAAGLLPKPIDFRLLRQKIDKRLERTA